MIEVQDYLKNYRYCEDPVNYKRFKTREVNVGEVPLGGDHPVRVQSMTVANTRDTGATVEETLRLVDSGCDYVRITAPSIKDAQNLENIKKGLRQRGCRVPLIADIHFTPNAAEMAARIVEKVRINPGNFADKKKFKVFEISDEDYERELDRIRNKFSPLVKICKEYGTAMRIGTNHGSLSDRIMNRYGDTPVGMVESALEFIRICEYHDFHDIVLSMKASNPKVMVEAYRLLVAKMIEEGVNYPLHLGVTEAGDGEEARIKSAAGIGVLLEDGLGDTVRVSLTEDPVNEAPVGRKLVNRIQSREKHHSPGMIREDRLYFDKHKSDFDPFRFTKRKSGKVGNFGENNAVRVINSFNRKNDLRPLSLNSVDHHFRPGDGAWKNGSHATDFIYFGTRLPGFELPKDCALVLDHEKWAGLENTGATYPLVALNDYLNGKKLSPELNFLKVTTNDFSPQLLNKLRQDDRVVLVLSPVSERVYPELRKAFIDLQKERIGSPVVIAHEYKESDQEQFILNAATDLGGLLIDGYGDGIWISYAPPEKLEPDNEARLINRLSFGILQATGTRISTTEYIACPSCGRTQFDLQETTAVVREETSHLKGVKIAVMGCIVNGPGEMADADYGYVGTGRGKVALYRGKDIVKRNLQSGEALDELINLIREDGNWVEEE